YISSRGFIHRDIAARNIMVDHDETCKIGDFGLTRSVGKEEDNYHSRGGKLPLKWMSPEAIEKYNFSFASDIWSFGVLLFEIVTLGGTPYAGWPAAEVMKFKILKFSFNFSCYLGCNMYTLMINCWSASPSARPSFSELRRQLTMLL
ncbi:hypothetical protein PMAYCL1PPCAC_22079, partial [Pristionchus mayeri]